MLTAIRETWRRLRRDERGNIFVLFGASSIPLLLIMGGAVDLARYTRHKADLSNAVDAASLALARVGEDYTEEQAKEYVVDYVENFSVTDERFTVDPADYVVTKTDNGFRVSAKGNMQTLFLPLGDMAQMGTGIMDMDVNITAEVVHNSNRLELALVLDNTGSMNCTDAVTVTCAMNWSAPPSTSRIVALRSAAKTLVDTLMKDDMDDPDQIKIALVPFEGTVNVASTGFSVTTPPSWVAWSNTATTTWAGRNFDRRNTSTGAIGCTSGTNCKYVGHKWLFDRLTADNSNVKWAGCVEMRAGTYELSASEPDPAVADSLYVPYFAPDEPDDANDGGNTYLNNYLEDRVSEGAASAQKDLKKYNSTSETRWRLGPDYDASTSPYESGPNRGCPKPIVPLTNADGKASIKSAIDGMIGYWASGTYIPAGLLWGWNVLTPELPYTEGLSPEDEYYEQTVKAIVLLTDGDNEVPALGNHNGSGYSAYSYVTTTDASGAYRLGSTPSAAATALDTKTGTLCTSVKAAGIRLYTITFGPLSEDTQTMMSNCATEDEGERLNYHAPTSEDLDEIFVKIGEDLSRVHLSM